MDTPLVEIDHAPDGGRLVRLRGAWNLRAVRRDPRSLLRRLASCTGEARWDLTGVLAFDSAAAAVLWRAWGGRRPEQVLLRDEHAGILERVANLGDAAPPTPERVWTDPLAALGRRSIDAVSHAAGIVALMGQLLLDVVHVARRPGAAPLREFSANVHRTGALALPITALVGFLIGVVVSYLSAQQLRTFGANIFIVDLLGVAILRELGPLLAAILVAGRSGSAMTAQIGVMRLTQELDALAAMGISASLRLVLPKVAALTLVLPLLVLWTDALALCGGMLAAERELGVGPALFLTRLPAEVPISNFWLGLAKGGVFGFLIGIIACHFGLKIEPDTESLGARTTSSVVASITTVIVVDAVFAVVFSDVGL